MRGVDLKCKYRSFDIECGADTLDGLEYCIRHIKEDCVVCGKQATHDCGDIHTFNVSCGVPLCDDCHHTYDIGGRWGTHVRKISDSN